MPRGRPHKTTLVVLEEDRAELVRWTQRPKSNNSLAQRARIILGCAEGRSSSEVAKVLHLTNQTVCKWRSCYIARGPAGAARRAPFGCPAQDQR